MSVKRFFYALLAFCFCGLANSGRILYVSQHGGDIHPFTNGWASASTTIHPAVTEASDGDTIIVSNGTYTLPATLIVNKGVTVISLAGPEETVLDMGFAGGGVAELNHADAVLSGFTLTRGERSAGGGVRISAGTASNCFITINHCTGGGTGSGGAGFWLDGINALLTHSRVFNNTNISTGWAYGGGGGVKNGGTVRHTVITGNHVTRDASARYGRGVVVFNDGIVEYCDIFDNTSPRGDDGQVAFVREPGGGILRNSRIRGTGYGVLVSHEDVLIRNCLVYNCSSRGINIMDSTVIENCTLVGNSHGIYHQSDVTLAVVNTIAYDNTEYDIQGRGTTWTHVTNSLFSSHRWLASSVDNLIGVDPLFADPDADDYRLQRESPAIDAGLNDLTWMDDAVDLDNNPRILIGNLRAPEPKLVVDIGAWEYVPPAPGTLIRFF